jgi:hypothetical protein
MILRAFASAVLAICIASAVGAALAQERDTGAAPESHAPPLPAGDPTSARIKYLHDRLRITTEQEELWDKVAQAIRDSAGNLAPVLKERFRATTNGTAPELLHAYQALGEAQLDHLRNIVAVFEPLYTSLSESQKKIADAVLREGAQNALMSGVPFVPPPFTSALAFPSVVYPPVAFPFSVGEPGLPGTAYSPAGFRHFHGFIPLHAHFGRLHHR